MADVAERLAVLIEANTKSYERAMTRLESVTKGGFDRAARSSTVLSSSLDRLRSNMRSAGATLLAAFGTQAIARSIGNAINLVSELGDAADRTGLSVEFLQVFRTVVEQAGGDIATANKALEFFTRNIGRLATEGGPAMEALRDLGINIFDTNGRLRENEDILRDVIAALSAVEDEAIRASVAGQIFGERYGIQLSEALHQGMAGMDEMQARMERLGLIMSDEMVRKAQETGDQLQFLGQIISTRFNIALIDMMGASDGSGDAIERLGDKIGDLFDFISRNIGLITTLVGALAGLMIAGPIGAAIGGMLGAWAGMSLGASTATESVETHRAALETLQGVIGGIGNATTSYVQNRVTEARADLDAAMAALALMEARKAAVDEVIVGPPDAEGRRQVQIANPMVADYPGLADAIAEQQGIVAGLRDGLMTLYQELANRQQAGVAPAAPGAGGGLAPVSPITGMNVAELRQSMRNEEQILTDAMAQRLADIEHFEQLGAAAGGISANEAARLRLQVEREYLADLAALRERAAAAGAGGGGGGTPITEEQRKKTEEVLKALNEERLMLSLTSREQAIYNALAEAGIGINSVRAGEIIAAVDALIEEQETLEGLNALLEETESLTSDFFHGMLDALEDGKLELDEILGLLDDLKRKLLSLALDMAINNLFSALSSIVGGAVAGGGRPLLSAIARGFGLAAGGKASGGPVQAGRPYMVGERRPELFIPNSAGIIRPGVERGGGGTIVQIINNGANVREERRRGAGGQNILRFIIDAVRQGVGEGGLDDVFGARFGARNRLVGRGGG